MAFDPDAYLAEKEAAPKTGGFDPDAYLASKGTSVQTPIKMTDNSPWYQNIRENIARKSGAATRGIYGGLASTLDIPSAVASAGARGLNLIPGVNVPVPVPDPMQRSYRQLFDVAGVSQPSTPSERVIEAVTAGAAGAGGTANIAAQMARTVVSPVAKGVLGMMAAAPRGQVIAGATGAGAGQLAAEAGSGQGGQMAASLAGALAPSVPSMLGAGTRAALTSGETVPSMMERAKTFEAAGATTPSAGQVTGGRTAQAIESALSKIPGGAGPMAKAAERQAEEIGTKAIQIADKLSTTATPATAGNIIEKGIAGEGGFITRFKQGQKVLYDKLDEYLPKTANVDISHTKQTLAAMNSDIPNAPALSRWFKNAKIQGIEAAIRQDTTPAQQTLGTQLGIPVQPTPTNVMPYESIKKIRSLVGAELDNPSLASDVPRSHWKNLYAALSQDLDNAAISTGNPEAIKAMKRANSFTRAGYDRIESVLDKVVGKNTPEEIFKSATSTTDMQAGATKISSVMKSLEPAERDVVKSAFIRRMGLATAGQQGAEGTTFSTQTFLTNWNKISPQAKSVLFSGKDGELRKSLDQIAKASEYVKEGSKVFSNISGTAQGTALTAGVGSVAGALASGHLGAAGMLLGGMGAANLTAKMMTNPKFVTWLAKSSKVSPSALPAAINVLNKAMENEHDDVKNDVSSYLDAVQSNIPAQRQNVPVPQLMQNTQ